MRIVMVIGSVMVFGMLSAPWRRKRQRQEAPASQPLERNRLARR